MWGEMTVIKNIIKVRFSAKTAHVLPAMILFIFSVLILSGNQLAAQTKTPALQAIHFAKTDRIMVLAPHPDDESLGTAGIIRYSVEHKIPALVVLMNNGDGYIQYVKERFNTDNPTTDEFKTLGNVRHHESVTAMKSLGLKDKDLIYLSYPDGGTNALYDFDWDCDNLHAGVNGATHAPYPYAYEKNAPYCGENVVKNLEEIIRTFKPTMIFYPDPGDDHHDHWATGAFAKYTLIKIGFKGKQYTYLVHKGGSWPSPWKYLPNTRLLPPDNLVGFDEKWYGFNLTKSEERFKFSAIKKYVSQYAEHNGKMEDFFGAFVRKNELYASYPILEIKMSEKQPRFLAGQSLPDAIFEDPLGDTAKKEYAGPGDLTAVGLVFNKKFLWIALQTKENVSPDVAYGFHLRIFGKTGIKRIDVKVLADRSYQEKLARNNMILDYEIPFEKANDRMFIQLPTSIFDDDVKNFMLCVDTAEKATGEHIDKTAWRIFKL
jgi:N-acetyl-1-D-myo-inositol-2-amino-2-deoxy-alpha-D-glucopyranoside deacetylase